MSILAKPKSESIPTATAGLEKKEYAEVAEWL
ncbi:MAG: hypothetical protein ACI9WR_000908, partial [Paracoccaceae bacterium]